MHAEKVTLMVTASKSKTGYYGVSLPYPDQPKQAVQKVKRSSTLKTTYYVAAAAQLGSARACASSKHPHIPSSGIRRSPVAPRRASRKQRVALTRPSPWRGRRARTTWTWRPLPPRPRACRRAPPSSEKAASASLECRGGYNSAPILALIMRPRSVRLSSSNSRVTTLFLSSNYFRRLLRSAVTVATDSASKLLNTPQHTTTSSCRPFPSLASGTRSRLAQR